MLIINLAKLNAWTSCAAHHAALMVNQFAATTAYEMQMLANMACFAKNLLARRSGASPCCQWAHGRNSILSEPDAIEAKEVRTVSAIDALRQSDTKL